MLRRALPDDLETVMSLVAEYCASDHHEFEPDMARAGIEPLLADDRWGVIWLVQSNEYDNEHENEYGEDPLGYAVVVWGWSLEIGGIDVVLDEFYLRRRGEGIGAQVHAEIVADLRARGVARITLETERHNDGARRFYSRLGYDTETSIWMTLPLDR